MDKEGLPRFSNDFLDDITKNPKVKSPTFDDVLADALNIPQVIPQYNNSQNFYSTPSNTNEVNIPTPTDLSDFSSPAGLNTNSMPSPYVFNIPSPANYSILPGTAFTSADELRWSNPGSLTNDAVDVAVAAINDESNEIKHQ